MDELQRAMDDILIEHMPAGLYEAVRDAVAKGATVEGCVRAARRAAPEGHSYAVSSVEALATRLVAARDARGN